jgi:Zn-dependent protease
MNWIVYVLASLGSVSVAYGVHELAHYVAAKMLGVRIKKFGFSKYGVYLIREQGTLSQNRLISAAGPLSNVLMVGVCHRWPLLVMANLVLAVVNLLPISNSDGCRIWDY